MVVSLLPHGTPRWDNKVLSETRKGLPHHCEIASCGGVPLPLKHQSKQSWAKVPNHSRICWSLQIELSLSKPHFVTIYHSTKSQKAPLNSIKVTQGLLGRQMDITNVCNVKNPCVPMRCAVKIIPNDNSIPMVVSHLSHGTPRWDNKVLPETT